ncbi:hypothetical protein Ciccas_003724 [Cichlidogyrus casuarinus]|uniref:MAU2 chromatid cohesion factor homolog n=1 Tax=Cichlidogyrus casuarinus TaxID=1844966 RepID=A0ABD2QDR1_9PLAT
MTECRDALGLAQQFINSKTGTPYQQESLLIFYLVIDVSYHLICGRAKSAHPVLKQLHQSIQRLARLGDSSQTTSVSCPEIDRFEWMPQEYMVILVYLVTVVQLMQSGALERAQRSADKALTQIEKLCDIDSSPLLPIFHVNLLEHTAMGRLVMGVNTAALEDISKACRICNSNNGMLVKRLPQLHTLLGLYSMSMNLMQDSEAQFTLALNFLVNRIFREAQQVLETCHCLKAASSYVAAFLAFCQNKIPEAKQLLRETVNLGNEEELNRISTSALITMGQIHFNENSLQEGKRVISAAISVAEKLPDIGIQLWATALLKEIAKSLGEAEEERKWFAEHDRYSKMVITDYYKAARAPDHHILVPWLNDPLPALPVPSVQAPTSETLPMTTGNSGSIFNSGAPV